MKYAASAGSSASSGTTTGIQGIHVVSSPVSEWLLSAGDMVVLVAIFDACVAALWGNFECHERLLDRRRLFYCVEQGWRCPMSKWFRFGSLALRLSPVGRECKVARSGTDRPRGLANERLWPVTNATRRVQLCDPDAASVGDHDGFATCICPSNEATDLRNSCCTILLHCESSSRPAS